MTDTQTHQRQGAPRARSTPALAALVALALSACSAPGPGQAPGAPFDPYEATNRATHEFNKDLDRKVIRPISHGYSKAVPDDIETAISRFATNISIPRAVVNNILQGNMRGATEDSYRFIVNSTVGLAGLFDPATELGMPKATGADFGQTLHVWGVREGAYVEIPVLGPSTERDFAGIVVDIFTDPLGYVIAAPQKYYVVATKVPKRMTERTRFTETIDSVLYGSADSYAQSRSLYLQKRHFELGESGSNTYLDPYDTTYGASSEDPADVPNAQ